MIGDSNIILMCLIFLFAGAFALVTKQIGAVDAVVSLGVGALPAALILPALFLRLRRSHWVFPMLPDWIARW